MSDLMGATKTAGRGTVELVDPSEARMEMMARDDMETSCKKFWNQSKCIEVREGFQKSLRYIG
jgi:hypothetical protein